MVEQAAPHIHEQLSELARRRIVFLAGVPGAGKSLLVHQLAHLAHHNGRTVHLLQWDLARPVFQASDAATPYPEVEGVTDPLIRRAAGLWARAKVAAWARENTGESHLLVGETPLIGNRFIELAQKGDDAAEPVLAAPSCRFVLAIPTPGVRRHIEAERDRRSLFPLHEREREDASPQVMRDLWLEIVRLANELQVATKWSDTSASYDVALYRAVYEKLLQDRHFDRISFDTVLPTQRMSVYDFNFGVSALTPTPEEAESFIHQAEAGR